MIKNIELDDNIIFSLAKLVGDSQSERREPSHSEIDFLIEKFNLKEGDPKSKGFSVGKTKRVRSVLSWAIENNSVLGEKFTLSFIQLIKSCGGFRQKSSNYVGAEGIKNLQDALKSQSIQLDNEGNLNNLILNNLNEIQMEEALWNYAKRAKKGQEDAALLTGTSKDLLEAVSAHILMKLWGTYPEKANFPNLLGQAFAALSLDTTHTKNENDTEELKAKKRVNTAYYELACSINSLRNKTGTGHGRPFLPSISDEEAKAAIESMGVISEYLLSRHRVINKVN